MTTKRANRPNRKVNDEFVIRLNNLGISLATIARELDCNPSTITLRLQELGIAPVDTRRAFAEYLFTQLTEAEQIWLSDQVSTEFNLKHYMTKLIKDAYANRK